MTNTEFLEKASRLQREFMELYEETGLVAIYNDRIQVTAHKFHELEREEGLLQHISKKLDGSRRDYEAMTPDGVKIIAIGQIEDKR